MVSLSRAGWTTFPGSGCDESPLQSPSIESVADFLLSAYLTDEYFFAMETGKISSGPITLNHPSSLAMAMHDAYQ